MLAQCQHFASRFLFLFVLSYNYQVVSKEIVYMAQNRGIRLDDETYLKLQIIAKRDERSTNKLIVVTLKKFIEEYEAQKGVIDIDVDSVYE